MTAATTDKGPHFDAFPELFDRFTRIWDEISTSFDDWLLASLPDRTRTAVDLGCGAGRHSLLLADRVDRVLAVDLADRMLDVARADRSRPNINYRHGGVLDVTGSYDVVLSVHTLHHVGNPADVLPHVRSLVTPGGTLVVADIVDPGAWENRDFHVERAFADARLVYQLTGDGEAAADVVRLLLHPRWLDLTDADTPLTREVFHRVYQDAFPGAVFVDDLNPVMCGFVWRAPG